MKTVKTCFILLMLIVSVLIMSNRVFAWFRVNKVTTVTIEDVEEPYWIDLLIPKDDHPLLTNDDLELLLPGDYQLSAYSDMMNAYQDADGYVSFRLYYADTYYIQETVENTFEFNYYSLFNANYKIILVFEDGTYVSTVAIEQSYDVANITYDLRSIEVVQTNQVYPVIIQPEPDLSYFYLSKLLYLMLVVMVLFALDSIAIILFGKKNIKDYMLMGLLQIPVICVGMLYLYMRDTHLFNYIPYFALFAFLVLFILEFRFLSLRDLEKKSWIILLFLIILNLITCLGVVQIGIIFL